MKYADLPGDLRIRFDTYPLDVIVLSQTDEDEVREMFLRLQNGTTLKAQERRNAFAGKMRDFVRTLASHSFFHNCGFGNSRYTFDHIAAQMTAIELNGGPCNVKNLNLNSMYEDNQAFDTTSGKAKKIRKVLDYLLENGIPCQDPRARAVQCYFPLFPGLALFGEICNAEAVDGTYPKGRQLGLFTTGSSASRDSRALRMNSSPRKTHGVWDFQNWHSPIQLNGPVTVLTPRTQSSGGRSLCYGSSLKRCQILNSKMISVYSVMSNAWRSSAETKDAVRSNSSATAASVEWDAWEADHSKPWSKGGRTIVANGRPKLRVYRATPPRTIAIHLPTKAPFARVIVLLLLEFLIVTEDVSYGRQLLTADDKLMKRERRRTGSPRTSSLYRYEPKRQIDGETGIFDWRGGVQCPSVGLYCWAESMELQSRRRLTAQTLFLLG